MTAELHTVLRRLEDRLDLEELRLTDQVAAGWPASWPSDWPLR
jgi:hypothetical protein